MKDIIDRLEDGEQCIDAMDDAIEEIKTLRKAIGALIEGTRGWHSVNDCEVEGRTDCELCKAIKEGEHYIKGK